MCNLGLRALIVLKVHTVWHKIHVHGRGKAAVVLTGVCLFYQQLAILTVLKFVIQLRSSLNDPNLKVHYCTIQSCMLMHVYGSSV